MTSRDTRREGRRTRRIAGRPEWCARLVLLVPLLAVAAPGCGPEPTPAPTPTPTVSATQPTPGCGNGIIDPGESCDGEPFCVNCSLGIASGCCEIGTPDDGAICIDVGVAGAQACITVGGGRFSIGTTCAGPPCGFGGGDCHLSGCTDEAIPPVSICCQRTPDRCQARVLESSSAVSSFALLECNTTGEETAVVGTCGDDGRCIPGH